ncbi:hypothetical protein [Siminovitchia fortis]|uniref:hypothetical protein n=1 Tax=Siminovitchia fortis TaxID=254758 RepID=UPI0021B472CF|nr:hypothetical protein [Siminovitchia fortis]
MFPIKTDLYQFRRFLPFIRRLPDSDLLEKKDLMNEHFFMEKDGKLEMYYAPHNEFINCHAEIVIVGITPAGHRWKPLFGRQNCLCKREMP